MKKLLLFLFFIASLNFAQAQISGTVFRDFNADGTQETAAPVEPGLNGVTVKAYNAAGTLLGSATTSNVGAYTFTVGTISSGTNVRLEFILPTGFYATNGAISNTTVQFVTAGSGVFANLGVNEPGDFCQADPSLTSPCYVVGAYNGAYAAHTAMVSFPYSSTGSTTPPSTTATHAQIGATWGVAYNKATKTTFTSAFARRGIGFGPGGTGAIYSIDNLGNVAQYATIPNTGTDPHNFSADPNGTLWYDIDSVAKKSIFPGKMSLGDMDISNDGTTLYVVNLNNKHLYSLPAKSATIPVPAGQITDLGDISTVSLTATGHNCPASDVRPFALGLDSSGQLFVGCVCSQESQVNAANTAPFPQGYILKYNGAGSFTSVFDFSFNFLRNSPASKYSRWVDDIQLFALTSSTTSPQIGGAIVTNEPILSDLQFIGKDIAIGVRPRGIDQSWNNGVIQSANQYFRVGWTGSTWTLENAGVAAGTTGDLPTVGYGPGNGNFYNNKNGFDATPSAIGGLAQFPGGDLVATLADPFVAQSMGVVRYRENVEGANPVGSQRQLYQVYVGNTSTGLVGKASGLGDLELLCNLAPLEIGNLVWNDANKNGIQDAGETGISGVTIDLYEGTTKVGTTTTDANGAYYFNNTNVNLNGVSGLQPDSSYQIRIATAQSALNTFVLTSTNTGSNTLIDNNGAVSGSNTYANVVLGAAGQNDHNYDFGFFVCPLPDFTLTKPTTCPGNTEDVVIGSLVNAATATATVSIDGGSYNTYPSGGTISGLSLGTHTIAIKNTNGCITTKSVTINAVTPNNCIPIVVTKN